MYCIDMMRMFQLRRGAWMRFLFLACIAASAFYLCAMRDGKSGGVGYDFDHQPLDRSQGGSYAGMLEEAQRSVVSVYTSELVQYLRYGGSSRDDLLREFLGMPRSRRQGSSIETRKVPQGVGSGVIVDSDGYIITNDHVIANQQRGVADEILVRLSNGREYKAAVVGRDPKTDIAVLKVDASGLPVAKITDSEGTKVGDVVFAIGNPMGVGLTVTSGIISAKNRNIGIYGAEGYENFIQTDASINPGNSGGALVDVRGRLVGINSAIMSRSGGNVGIGFAIPSNLAVDVSKQLIRNGRVQRRTIGVYISLLTARQAQVMGVRENAIFIKGVLDGSAAAKAGIRAGDVVTKINGRVLGGLGSFRSSVAHLKKGERIKVTVVRDKRELELGLTVE